MGQCVRAAGRRKDGKREVVGWLDSGLRRRSRGFRVARFALDMNYV